MSCRHYHISPVTYIPYHNHSIVLQIIPQAYHSLKDTTTNPILAYRSLHNPSSPADTIISPTLQTTVLSYRPYHNPNTFLHAWLQTRYCPNEQTTIAALSLTTYHNTNTVLQIPPQFQLCPTGHFKILISHMDGMTAAEINTECSRIPHIFLELKN